MTPLLLAALLAASPSGAVQAAAEIDPIPRARRAELRRLIDGWRAAKIESAAAVNAFAAAQPAEVARSVREGADLAGVELAARMEERVAELKAQVRQEGGADAEGRLAALDEMLKLRLAYIYHSMIPHILNETLDDDDDSGRPERITVPELLRLTDEIRPRTGFPSSSFAVSAGKKG